MKTNIIQVDLRTLTNRALYATYRFLDAKAAYKEAQDRGFEYFGMPNVQEGNPDDYGKFPTLEQYLNSLPEPQYKDTRKGDGC